MIMIGLGQLFLIDYNTKLHMDGILGNHFLHELKGDFSRTQ